MNPLFVDIDVSSRSTEAYLIKPDDSKPHNFSVLNSFNGYRQLVKRILVAITSVAKAILKAARGSYHLPKQ